MSEPSLLTSASNKCDATSKVAEQKRVLQKKTYKVPIGRRMNARYNVSFVYLSRDDNVYPLATTAINVRETHQC